MQEQVGEYTTDRVQLGEGRFSTVYEARHTTTGAEVAMKLQLQHYSADGVEENKMWMRVCAPPLHPNVLPLLAHYLHNSQHVFVMPMIRTDLLHWQKKFADAGRRPSLQLLGRIATHLFSALQHFKDRRLLHTDLKGENMLLDTSASTVDELEADTAARLVVCDYGNMTDDWEHGNSRISTREYSSPESIVGAPYSFPTDVWSAATVLFEFYTQDYLFNPHKGVDVRHSSSSGSSSSGSSSGSSSSTNSTDLNAEHLAQIEALCGPITKRMQRRGIDSRLYYRRSGTLRGAPLANTTILQQLTRTYGVAEADALCVSSLLQPMLDVSPGKRTLPSELIQQILNEWPQ